MVSKMMVVEGRLGFPRVVARFPPRADQLGSTKPLNCFSTHFSQLFPLRRYCSLISVFDRDRGTYITWEGEMEKAVVRTEMRVLL